MHIFKIEKQVVILLIIIIKTTSCTKFMVESFKNLQKKLLYIVHI